MKKILMMLILSSVASGNIFAAAEGSRMVFVHEVTGKVHTLRVPQDGLVQDLMRVTEEETGLSPESYRLIYGGTILLPGQNLRAVITDKAKFHLIRNIPSLDDQIRSVDSATQESQRAQEELGEAQEELDAFIEQHQAILDEYHRIYDKHQRLTEVAADAQRKLGSAEASLDSTLRRQAATSAQSQ